MMDMAKNLLLSCSCFDYFRHKIPCKHMYLVQRIHGDLGIKYSADAVPNSEVTSNGDPFGSALENSLSLHLLHQLQVARAEMAATKKRERDAADAEVFIKCNEEMIKLWRRLGVIVCDPSKRRCTVSYIQSAVVTLRNAMYEVEGVNRVGAGRRRQ